MTSSTVLPGLANVPPALRPQVEILLERFAQQASDNGLAIEISEEVIKVFTASPFVAELAIRRPEAFWQEIHSPQIHHARDSEAFAAAVAEVFKDCTDLALAKQALRQLRQIEMLRLAWRDIVCGTPLATVMRELSEFADAVVSGAVSWLHEQAAARFGRAYNDAGQVLELVVVAMGKLGGHELNYSSDIDLLFVFGASGTTRGGRKEVAHQDYFDRLGRELINLLNDITADGFVFRVDMRLRPFGDSGPLSVSLNALEHYYVVHGRDWERYAAIKARSICGDPASREALTALMRPFVYRRYLDFGALDALRDMKQRIHREAGAGALADNVKRGPGGIREIEFIAQFYQLVRGGREPTLRHRGLFDTLSATVQLGLLEDDEVAALCAAYEFLRVSEHRLQQVNDAQTHTLPDDDIGRTRLAYAFEFPDWAHYARHMEAHRAVVRTAFSRLLEGSQASDENDDRPPTPWQTLWQSCDDEQTLGEDARGLALTLEAAQQQLFVGLKSARELNRLTNESRARLDRLAPLLLAATDRLQLSDTAIQHLLRLTHGIVRRSVYLAFLADNPGALTRLLELFNASTWIAEQIIAQPLLLDELLDQRTLFTPPEESELRALAGNRIRVEDGLEVAMENLRAFRNQQVLRVAASDISGEFPVARVSDQLSSIAEACVESALRLAWGDLVSRFGEPHCDDGAGLRPAGLAILAYGKLGGFELGYGSDLDLVFVHDSSGAERYTDGPRQIENDVFFTRLAQRFIHILSTTTVTGRAYEVDMRLRPNGESGMMAPSLGAFSDYLLHDAWVWEHQALVRARAIAGNERVMARFTEVRNQVLAVPRIDHELKHEIATMRARILEQHGTDQSSGFDLKRGPGGMTDIEFMVQYAVLRGGSAHPSLLDWTDNLRLLETIATLKLLPGEACERLHDAYFAYRADIHRCALQQRDSVVDDEKYRQHRQHVIEIWNTLFS
jgi:[glutamine synthetase] adenylyltransferase / [glutamine synthetase]-adenylyl-L-tyrosine phosphorylase